MSDSSGFLLRDLARQAQTRGDAIAVTQQGWQVRYQELQEEIKRLAERFQSLGISRLALLLDNSPAWAAADLAAMSAGIAVIPVPHFFTPGQVTHLLDTSTADALLTEHNADALYPSTKKLEILGRPYRLQYMARNSAGREPEAVDAKLSFTSGTTGQPKGVRLGATVLNRVSASLAELLDAGPTDRHLCLLPLTLLLENVAGLHTALRSGAICCLPGNEELGWQGSSSIDPSKLFSCLVSYQPTSLILVPALLQLLVSAIEQGAPPLPSLRVVAVGGAPVSPVMLQRAASCGLPVLQGYGLTEACSVVAMNTPGNNRPGSVGQPLPHSQIRIADNGEILVGGALCNGYLSSEESAQEFDDDWWPTGDLGFFDSNGFLFLTGRIKSQIITPYGRNVAPEWVESELCAEPGLLQAAVFGDGLATISAVITADPRLSRAAVKQRIAATNARLPDYARVSHWTCSEEPFGPGNGQLSASGVLRRQAIFERYRNQLTQSGEDNAVFRPVATRHGQ